MMLIGLGMVTGVVGATADLAINAKLRGRPLFPSEAMDYCKSANPIYRQQFAHWFIQTGLNCWRDIVCNRSVITKGGE
jgi:hypothetical protein